MTIENIDGRIQFFKYLLPMFSLKIDLLLVEYFKSNNDKLERVVLSFFANSVE